VTTAQHQGERVSDSTTLAIDLVFVAASYPDEMFDPARYAGLGIEPEALRDMIEERRRAIVVVSGTHQVEINGTDSPMPVWLSIKRRTKEPIDDRRELALIMRALAAEPCVGFELLPAPDRVVDTSNQYHVHCAPSPLHLPDDPTWIVPPHHGDWRDLWQWKEAQFPGHEAALYWGATDEDPHNGQLLLAPLGQRFPFGFAAGLVTTDPFESSVQAPLDDAYVAALHAPGSP
jgi:hypothetical protein